ncbi:MAG: hypothetical protein WBV82_02180 [Myxococcaceae bacterium]
MGAANDKSNAEEPRQQDERRQQMKQQFEAQVGQLLTTAEQTAQKFLRRVTKQLPDSVARPLEEAGTRALRDGTSRLHEMSTTEMVQAAYTQLKTRPALSVASLLGVGVLAGRLVRAVGAKASAAA